MINTTNKGPWAIKNAVIPVDTDTEAFEIERAAARLGADADGYDLDADDHIIGVSVTGPAETIDVLVKLFTDDAPDEAPEEAPEEAADFDAMVQAWRDDPAHENIDAALEANATDTTNEPRNLYRAGVFAGLAEAAAWMIYEGVTTDDADDINAITAAIYKAYRVAW